MLYVLMRNACETETAGTINDLRPSTTLFLQSLQTTLLYKIIQKTNAYINSDTICKKYKASIDLNV